MEEKVPAIVTYPNNSPDIEIQTEQLWEEISDRIPEKDVETQTDPFQDRPPTPQFIPPKEGVDVETQIWPGDLFDFDTEVEPILSTLIAKTLEQSLLEVQEEEEIASMQAHREAFKAKRLEELAETQLMEEEERRKEQEKVICPLLPSNITTGEAADSRE